MPVKNIFDKPFDEGTKVKLEIFQQYFEKWLPTFIMSDFSKPIQVFDLFAGSGQDKNGIPGSPLRIIETINKHARIISEKNKKIHLFFNDLDKSKIDILQSLIANKIREQGLGKIINFSFTNVSFYECLKSYNAILKNGCNLIFIDQNGFKEVNENIFHFLIKLETTEFIFFISSSHIHRFADEPEVQKYHPKFDFSRIKSTSRKKIHNIICQEFKKYVPGSIKSYGLIPFSIMKDDHNNVYGLIFVSRHIAGADKFLNTVWTQNLINGNANFDIDEDLQKNQLDIFDGKKPTKIEGFQTELKELIINGKIKNNRDAYLYTINQGHISRHADEEIRRMKKENLISFESPSSLVNYNMVIKEKRFLEYHVVIK